MDSNLSSFVLWLPVGFVQWEAQQEIKGWEEGEVEIVLPCHLPLGCCSSSVAAWLEPCLTVGAASPVGAPLLCEPSNLWEPLFSGAPPVSPYSSSHQTLETPVPSPGPFSIGEITASAIASPYEKSLVNQLLFKIPVNMSSISCWDSF